MRYSENMQVGEFLVRSHTDPEQGVMCGEEYQGNTQALRTWGTLTGSGSGSPIRV